MTHVPRRVAIIQARMSSSRFPGKVLADLVGKPMILYMIERVRQARLVDHLVVATSTDARDDALAAVLNAEGVDCFRGDLNDVLDRFTKAARQAGADHVVRLTGDCPLMDGDLIDRALDELAHGDADYVSNVMPPTYPDGLDVECFTREALETAWREASLPSDREHVTPFIRAGRGNLCARGWRGVADLSHLRWTVDHTDDLEHVKSLVKAATRRGTHRPGWMPDRFEFLRVIETGAVTLAGRHARNEGYLKSLAEDNAR
jgi:spore coat polysaccharide biosynthesis protein SpsF